MKIYDVEKIGLAFDSMNTGDLPDAFVDKRDYDSLDRAYESLKAEYEKWKKEPPLIARAAIVERNIAIKERDEARADYEHADKLFEERCQQLKAERAKNAELLYRLELADEGFKTERIWQAKSAKLVDALRDAHDELDNLEQGKDFAEVQVYIESSREIAETALAEYSSDTPVEAIDMKEIISVLRDVDEWMNDRFGYATHQEVFRLLSKLASHTKSGDE